MISKQEVKHIAKLARLRLTEKEIVKMQKELSTILDYFNLLKEVEVKTKKKREKSPLDSKHLMGLENITREDSVKKQSPKTVNKLYNATPKKEKGYVKVKAIL